MSALDVAPPRTDRTHNLRAVVRERGFRRLMSVRLLGQVGDGFFQAGLAGSVLFNPQDKASPAAIAAGFALLLLPYSLIGPYLGVFLDRWRRRTIMHLCNLLRAALVLPAVTFVWSGQDSPVFFVLVLLIIGMNRFFLASVSAAVPHVVDDRRLVTANAISGTIGSIAFSVGLGIAALGVKTVLSASFHGYAVVASFALLFYFTAAILVRRSFEPGALGPDDPPDAPLGAAVRQVWRDTADGVAHLVARRGALYVMGAQSAFRFLHGVLGLTTLLLYRTTFNDGDDVSGAMSGIGQVFAAGGVGLLVAAFVTPPVARIIGGWRWVTGQLFGVGAALLVFGLPLDPVLILVAVFTVGLSSQAIKIVVDTSLQHECADDFRGRVFSVNDTMFNLCFVAGTATAAALVPADGRSRTTIVTVAAGYILIGAVYAVLAGRWARRAGDDIALPDG